MTELRDARFLRALQAAPDARLQPQEATRHAVREAAAKAIASRIGGRRWWSWWSASERRMPWNAAFATVLLASLVALLWQDRDVPNARTEASRVDIQAPPPAAPAPAPAPPAAPQAAPPPRATPRAAPAPREERRPTQASEGLHKSAPQEDLARQREAAAPLQDSAAPAAAPVPAPPPAPAAAAPMPRGAAPAAPAAELSARFQTVPDWHQWSQLRIEQDGQAITVPRERASHLAGLIERMVAGATTQEPLAEPAQPKLELGRRDGRLLGVLELAGDQVRWTVPGAAPRTGRPDPAALQALREELQRLAQR